MTVWTAAPTKANPHPTKSRAMAGLQCLRRLWLLAHQPPDYEEPWRHAEAVARTATLMAGPAVPAILEAAFTHADVRIRIDVLERLSDGWGLREVKSGAGVKDHHLDDVGLRLHVLEGTGVAVRSAEALHVNNAYVGGSGEVDWPAATTTSDVLASPDVALSWEPPVAVHPASPGQP